MKRFTYVLVCGLAGCSNPAAIQGTPTTETVSFDVAGVRSFVWTASIVPGEVSAERAFVAPDDATMCVCIGGTGCRPACGKAPTVSWGPDTIDASAFTAQVYRAQANASSPAVAGTLAVTYLAR